MAVVAVQPIASCSKIMLESKRDKPKPPASSGVYKPQKPSSPAALIVSLGKICSRSHLAACGASSDSANWRAVCAKAC